MVSSNTERLRTMRPLSFLAPFLALSTTAFSQLLVQTEQGPVVGTADGPNTRRWLGIPYAVANRWEAPQAPSQRSSVLAATEFGDSCYQSLTPSTLEFLNLVGGAGTNVTESENCLSVNIWAPGIGRKQDTAVLVWIYGGAFNYGTSNIDSYHGATTVKEHDDITVVTFNYRTNVFSHPSAPQLLAKGGPQNFALLDVFEAIDWVYANIANFGGDPNRITIFGQSAGGAAVDAYSFANPDSEKVKGLIEMSGAISGRPGTFDMPPSSSAWKTVAEALGCGGEASVKQFDCMKAVPGRTLQDAVINTESTFNIVVDNVTVHYDTIARAAEGKFLKVPLMIGSTAEEADIYTYPTHLRNYGGVVPGLFQMQADAATLLGFSCPVGVATQYRVRAGVPTWRYLYQGVFPNISIDQYLRAFHASDIQMVFGTYNNSEIPPTLDQIALSNHMQRAWVDFARNPSSGLISSEVAWPRFDGMGKSLVLLGNRANAGGASFTNGTLVDMPCTSQRQTQLAAISAQLGQLLG
ncbi:carboxylesterase [Coprinopsis sp. MPI-PUGE-AT-0042]|nr:carboxylesterase [Coprinopsis sp. MPI-PUGE-AT-0042]